MGKRIFRIIGLATLSIEALLAQDITGTWQGKLAVPQAPDGHLRIVIKISKAERGGFKAMLYSIDQPGPGVAASAVTLQGSSVKITIPGIGGIYEGKLDSDAIAMTGSWTQGPRPLALNLAHVKDQAAWEIPAPPPPLKMMASDANPVFEVATIKPSDPNRPGKLFSIRGVEVITANTTVIDLMIFAYGVHARQILSRPGWAESEKFDITGKPEGGGLPNINQFKTMIQRLLAERFQLAFHHETKELTVYAITIGKNGPKLTRSESVNTLPTLLFRGLGNLPARDATMEEFASVLQGAVLDRPVVDQTGLKGRFDFQLQWTPDETQFASLRGPGPLPSPPEGAETPPDLFTAIQQQLGLKLESIRAQTDVLVIDKVEKPSEN